MKIILGTQAAPKVKAVQQSINEISYFKGKKIEIVPLNVSSDISDMPTTLQETMLGAKNRALNCKKKASANFYVGMEGGTQIVEDKAYLFGVVYILDQDGNGHYGFSNMMEVPEYFKKKIYDEGLELGPVLAEVTKEENASKKGGAFGHWTDNILTRTDQFSIAFKSAIAPFFNRYYKL